MAKFAAEQAGSSCHVHFSLWREGQNVFPGDRAFGPVQCWDDFRWFLGGWMAHVPDVMLFFAPTINSYKRYATVPGRLRVSHGATITAPRGSGWSAKGSPSGSSVAYLARTATLTSPSQLRSPAASTASAKIEPPSISSETSTPRRPPPRPVHAGGGPRCFRSQRICEERFRCERRRSLRPFLSNRAAAYNFAVTDWERRRYFERI